MLGITLWKYFLKDLRRLGDHVLLLPDEIQLPTDHFSDHFPFSRV